MLLQGTLENLAGMSNSLSCQGLQNFQLRLFVFTDTKEQQFVEPTSEEKKERQDDQVFSGEQQCHASIQ